MQNDDLFSDRDTLKKLLTSLPGHVYWYALDGTIYGLNQTQAESLGFKTVEEAIGKNVFELLPYDSKALRAVNKDIEKQGRDIVSEEPFTHLNGEKIVMLSHKAPWYDQDGKISGIVGVSLNIQSHKDLENELSKNTSNIASTLENIIDLIPAYIYWQDLNDVYLGCNLQEARLAGLKDKTEIIGKTNDDMPWRNEADKLKELNKKVIETNSPYVTEEYGTDKNGEKVVTLTSKAPLRDRTGAVIGIIGISFDITAQKKAEELRVSNVITEEKLKIAKTQAASIAHELRTPLAAVAFASGALRDTLPELMKAYELAVEAGLVEKKLRPNQFKALKDMPQNLNAITIGANTFIDMLLMKVNLENKHARKEDLQVFILGPVIYESVQIYPFSEAFHREDVVLNLHQDFEVKADPLFIRHIIFNLLKNSIYHILKKAGISRISIWTELGEKSNFLYFEDTGPGMPKEVSDNLFTPFFTKTHHGTGVGLALCAMFMEEFGGSIRCESEEGQFARFILEFPKVNNTAVTPHK